MQVSNLHSVIHQYKESLLKMEKKLPTRGSPAKPGSNISGAPTTDNRPPWNHGGGFYRSNSTVPYVVPKQRSPVRTRSRTPNPSVRRKVSPAVPGSHHKTRTLSKNIVHKQTINASDKTIVEVSVKTKQQGKRTRNTVNPSLTSSADQLVHQFANVVISPEGKKYDPPCVTPGVVPALKKDIPWSNILGQRNSHLVMPDCVSNKRSCEVSPNYPKRRPAASPFRGFPRDDFLDVNDGQTPSTIHHQDSGDSNIPWNTDAYRKLHHLVQELRRNASDPITHRISAELESLANSHFKENVEPASLRPDSRQPTHQRRNLQAPSTSTRGVNGMLPHEWNIAECNPPADSNLFRLSPFPNSAEPHLPKSKTNGYKSGISHLVDEFLQTLSAAAQSPQSPEEKHHSKKPRRKDVTAWKEEVEVACRAVEVACVRIEADGEKMKLENIELQRNLQHKTEELLTARKSLDERNAEVAKLRASLHQASLEIEKLRAEEARKGSFRDYEKNGQSREKRLEQLTEENKNITIDLNMIKMERDKLAVMLTNKDKELDRLRNNITTRKPRTVITEVLNLGDPDTEVLNIGKSEKRGYVKNVVKPKKGRAIKNGAKLEEEEDVKNVAHSKDIENDAKSDEEQDVDLAVMKRKESVLIEGTGTPRRYFFRPVNKEWQLKMCERFRLKIVRHLKVRNPKMPLNPPKACESTGSDGNCFFRCISLYLVGDECEHEAIRAQVVKYMRRRPSEFEEGNDEKYITKMAEDGTWATEVEIRATAKMLCTPIFTWAKYNEVDWKWLRFGPGDDLIDDSFTNDADQSLYIKNSSSCHYDVVKTVETDEES